MTQTDISADTAPETSPKTSAEPGVGKRVLQTLKHAGLLCAGMTLLTSGSALAADAGLEYDPLYYPYAAQRNVVYGSKGMVATAHPLAAQAGLDVLKKGGNAIDAALATAAALTVVEPTSNGIGSDAFAIIWYKGKLYGINGSGRAPQGLTPDLFKGEKKMPMMGWKTVTLPTAPKTWATLAQRFGKLPLTESFAPAVAYARDGFAVAPTVSYFWNVAVKKYTKPTDAQYRGWKETFTKDGRGPLAGELWQLPDHANTLELIAKTNADAFYKGELADKMVAFAKATGGYLTKEELASVETEWVDPISVNYRGYDIWEIPPNGQGIAALMALSILKGYEFNARSPETTHLQIEAMKLAFADSLKYVADQRFSKVPVSEMISDTYGAERRALIGDRAIAPKAGDLKPSGTVYLCTADGEGNMVSYIQSNYAGFGSGVVVPETGIALNNRASCFNLEPDHANTLAPGKRPYNTIIPGFMTKDGQAVGPFGVMGGYMQPQGHIQVIMNTIDFKMNPQQALDAPRWQWAEGMRIDVETSFPGEDARKLERMGHEIRYNTLPSYFGRGQIIWRTPQGTLIGGTESRADGCIAAW